jgi:hypothetical protein
VNTRLIHRTAAAPTREIAECLEGLILSEYLDPGKRLIIVSPWMGDFPAVDNRSGAFASVEPSWNASYIRLSTVLRGLLSRGLAVRIGCGEGTPESELIGRIEQGADADGTRALLSVSRLPRQHPLMNHEKAIVADTWAMHGSMNITYAGVSMNGELITVTTDPNAAATVATELLGLFP